MKQKKLKKQSLGEGAAILLLASVLVKLIGALFKIPLSSNKVLGDLGFGYFSSAYDLFSPVYTIAVSGLPIAISRIVADFTAQKLHNEINTVFKTAKKLFLTVGIISGLIMLILAFPFVKLTDSTGKSIYSMLAVVPSFAICFTASVYRGYFEGLHNMNIAALSSVIEALGKLILGLGFAIITIKLTDNIAFAAAGAMAGITIGTLFSLIYLWFSYKFVGNKQTHSKTKTYENKKIIKLIIYISLPIVLSSMANSVISLIDAVTVRWQLSALDLSSTYSEALNKYLLEIGETLTPETLPTFLYGIKSKAFTLYNLVPTLTVAIGISAIPAITESFAKKDSDGTLQNTESVLKLSSVISLPAAAGFIALNENIMALLFGEGVSAQIGGKMLLIYGVSVAFSGISIPLCCVLQGLNCQRKAFINVICGILFKLIFNLTLCAIPDINILGSAISTLICNAVIFILHMITLIKCIGFKFNLNSALLKPLFAAFLCGVIAYTISLFGDSSVITLLSITAAAIIYLISLINLSVFNEPEILNLPCGKLLLRLFNNIKVIK